MINVEKTEEIINNSIPPTLGVCVEPLPTSKLSRVPRIILKSSDDTEAAVCLCALGKSPGRKENDKLEREHKKILAK